VHYVWENGEACGRSRRKGESIKEKKKEGQVNRQNTRKEKRGETAREVVYLPPGDHLITLCLSFLRLLL
jgi:hypothetical protein